MWQVNVQDPGQVHWIYALPEAAIRGMTSGEGETLIVPITISEDGVGQSTENVRIDLIGQDEPTSMLSPGIVLTANTNIAPYLLPIDVATHVQTANYSLNEAPNVTGSTSHDTLSGTIAYVDPDVLNRPTVTMTVADMTHSLDANPGDGPFNAAVQPLMAGFSYTVESFGNYGNIHWTYDVQDSALDFLAQGASLTASANFSVGTLAGGAFTTVNINLQGANDAPVIAGPSTTFADVALHASTSGSFAFTDPDTFPDNQTVQFVPHDPNTHGFMTGGSDWTYIADFGSGTLVAGQHDVWDAVVQDHFGGVATHTFDFHLV
jgi:VCBS repeat-containing protein